MIDSPIMIGHSTKGAWHVRVLDPRFRSACRSRCGGRVRWQMDHISRGSLAGENRPVLPSCSASRALQRPPKRWQITFSSSRLRACRRPRRTGDIHRVENRLKGMVSRWLTFYHTHGGMRQADRKSKVTDGVIEREQVDLSSGSTSFPRSDVKEP
jgi:hypothetical protein